jgi:hypothetical protein
MFFYMEEAQQNSPILMKQNTSKFLGANAFRGWIRDLQTLDLISL